MVNRAIFLETFINKDDADYWLDQHLRDHRDLNILEAYVKFINGGWQAACMFGDGQYELELDIG